MFVLILIGCVSGIQTITENRYLRDTCLQWTNNFPGWLDFEFLSFWNRLHPHCALGFLGKKKKSRVGRQVNLPIKSTSCTNNCCTIARRRVPFKMYQKNCLYIAGTTTAVLTSKSDWQLIIIYIIVEQKICSVQYSPLNTRDLQG